MIISSGKLKNSFKAALKGLRIAHHEQTFQILCLCGFLVMIFIFVLGIRPLEKIIVIFLITSVLAFELLNTQIEKVLDFLQPDHDPRIKRIKDISAGAVFVVSIGAAISGILIFFPYILECF